MRIAVIDTGINIEFRDFYKVDITGINIADYSTNIVDENGHGTASVGEILRINKKANILVIKALDKHGKSSLLLIIKALEYCLTREDVNIINLSLSCEINDRDVILYFEQLINKIIGLGIVIVCSIANEYKYDTNKYGYPAKFRGVISVKHEYDEKYYVTYDKISKHYVLHSPFYMMPFTKNQYLFYKGNSCGAPQISGILSKIGCKTGIKKLSYYQEETNTGMIEINNELEDIIKGYCKEQYGEANYIRIQSQDCLNLLHQIESKYNILLNYKEFSTEDFVSVKRLVMKCSAYL